MRAIYPPATFYSVRVIIKLDGLQRNWEKGEREREIGIEWRLWFST